MRLTSLQSVVTAKTKATSSWMTFSTTKPNLDCQTMGGKCFSLVRITRLTFQNSCADAHVLHIEINGNILE